MHPARTALTLVAAAASIGGLGFVTSPAAQAAGDAGAVTSSATRPPATRSWPTPRSADGTLTFDHGYPTTGTGTGGGLGSQGAVIVDDAEAHLYAVDAGSSTITSFRITDTGLARVGTVPSGGTTPTSLTVNGDRLYALNAGGSGNITGFSVTDGSLSPLAGSTHALSGTATSPGEVSFTPDGSRLLVTERATNLVDVITLDGTGLPVDLASYPSSGAVPFGFDFDNKGHAIVSEAAASTTSSYDVSGAGLATISASVPNTEAAACWLVATTNGKFAYTGNAGGSLSISGYRVQPDGALSLLTPGGKTAHHGRGVTDLATSRNSRFLYSRLGNGTVGAFEIDSDGGLSPLPVGTGLPVGAAGIAAR